MREEEFDELVARLLTHEASDAEKARLRTLLAADPKWQSRFEALRTAASFVRDLGQVSKLPHASHTPIPEDRLRRLQAAVRQEFGGKRPEPPHVGSLFSRLFAWLVPEGTGGFPSAKFAFASLIVAGLILAIFFLRPNRSGVGLAGNGKPGATGAVAQATANPPSSSSNEFLKSLSLPANQFLAMYVPTTKRSGQSITVYSPNGSTRYLKPLLHWKSEPGKTYDLSITDELNADARMLRLTGVVPPVDPSQPGAWSGSSLRPGGLYKLLIQESGQPLSATEYTFTTLEEADGTRPSRPAEKIDLAKQLLAANTCYGDALAELLALPPELADTELALRLKLIAFGQLGFQEEYEATAGKLRRLARSPGP